jgi:hypothetical protein
MTGTTGAGAGVVLDEETLVALREILDDPSLPVASTSAGPDGPRTARLREALDHLVMVRAGAWAVRSPEAGQQLLATLAALDAELTGVLRYHVTAVEFLSALPPSRVRNAVLGDVGRGDLITLASSVREWNWHDGKPPAAERPLQRADGLVKTIESPVLYDTVLAWDEGTGGLVAIPTLRDGVGWAPLEEGQGWAIIVAGATFQADELIPLDRDSFDAVR